MTSVSYNAAINCMPHYPRMGGGRVGIRQLPHPLGSHWKQSPYKSPTKLQISAFKLLRSLVFTTPAVEDKDFLHPSATGQTEIQVLATSSSIATDIQPPYKLATSTWCILNSLWPASMKVQSPLYWGRELRAKLQYSPTNSPTSDRHGGSGAYNW